MANAGVYKLENGQLVPAVQTGEYDSQIATLTTNKANKTDLTNIIITGSKNNSGATITSGTFFYKSGTLVRAKVDIANGATLTQNTNYEVVTAGGLNALNNDLNKRDIIKTTRTITGDGAYNYFNVNYDSSNKTIKNISVSASWTWVLPAICQITNTLISVSYITKNVSQTYDIEFTIYVEYE